MMGRSHAISGAALWLAGTDLVGRAGWVHLRPGEAVAGMIVCAAGAILPDLDMSGRVIAGKGGATIAGSFGRVSLFAAECVEKASLGVYLLTRGRRDPDRSNGHRTLTHTLLFAAVAGWLVGWACHAGGQWAILATLFIAGNLALRGLAAGWAGRAAWFVVPATSAVVAAGLHGIVGTRAPHVIGAALGAGCVIHLLGDVITKAGVPALWPVPMRGRRWHTIGLPDLFAIRAGGWVELAIIRGLLLLIAAAATVALTVGWLYPTG